MKKFVISVMMVFFVFVGTVASNAVTEAPSVELALTPSVEVETGTKTVTLTLSLGDFVGIEEDCVMGYEGVLSYDTDVIESVNVQGANGWVASASPSTMVITGDTSSAKANTEITKIVCTLKEGLEPGTRIELRISNILLTDNTHDFSYDKTATITVKQAETQDPEPEQPTTPEQPDTTPDEKEDAGEKKGDQTVAKTPIPQTGIKNIAFVSIIVIVAIGVYSFIRIKTIKLK